LKDAAGMLKALLTGIRIKIVDVLKTKKRTVTEIDKQLGMNINASHHLGILKDKGVLASKRDWKNTWYF